MPILNKRTIQQYEATRLYSIIHNFQKNADDDHLIVYRHPIEEEGSSEDMRSKNREKNIRRQEQDNRRNYPQSGNQRVANDLGNFLGGGNQLPAPNQQPDYNTNYGNDYGYQQSNNRYNQLPQPNNTQRINPTPDYQVEQDVNSLNSPQQQEPNGNTNYFDLNDPNYYNNLNNSGSGYYQNQQQPQLEAPQKQQSEPEPQQDEATITYTDANGNPTSQEEVPVDMPNVNDNDEDDTYTVESNAPQENVAQEEAIKPVQEDEPEQVQEPEYDNSAEKSRIFQEIQASINTRKWVESIQEIQLAQKANFNNMPIDHIDLVGITNGVSDNTPYRIDLDPMFFKLFKIILIGQNLDITLLARDGNSTEINIAPPDWLQNDNYKDLLIDGNYLYSYDPNLDFDKLLETLYRFTYRPVQTKGYTELFITDLPIYPIMHKDDDK